MANTESVLKDRMSTKQKRAVREKKQAISRKEGWTTLSWDDLTEWAGSRSVERGRAYQKQGRVHDLAISEEDWLLATVTGAERYAVTVWCEQSKKMNGALYSRCNCPVGAGGCKHAVAVVAEYLEMLGEGAETPVADQDDERWEMLADESGEEDDNDEADDLDMDSEDDDNEDVFYVHRHRHPEASGKKTFKASDEKIRKHIEAKSREELLELVWSLTERFPELREEFRDRIALGEGDVDRLVTEARKKLRRVSSEAGWINSWTGEGHTPDYSRVEHRLERLLELGHPDAVVRLGSEIMTLGNEQIGQSNDEGETAEAVGECIPVIFQAVTASSLTPARKLIFAIDAHLQDEYDVINDSAKFIFDAPVDLSIWSEVADHLAPRLTARTKGDDADSRDYQRDRISRWLIEALEKAGRENEIFAVCEREARATGSYERLVRRLIEKKQYDEAERWAAEGIEKTIAKLPGIASSLGKLMGEMAIQRKQWAIAAAHAAWEFFDYPSRESFQQLVKAAAKAGCKEPVCNTALKFLETGVSPLQPSINATSTKNNASVEWPLPVPAYLLPLLSKESRVRAAGGPHFDVLIDMAIADQRHDDVLRWYDAMQAGQKHRGSTVWYGSSSYGDRVAAAVADSHPERSLAIYRQRVDDHLPHASVSAYEAVAGYLRKMRPILQALHREAEWDGVLADIRLRYKNRPKFMEILDKLDPRPIVEQRRARR
jgi:uncharacterized Zn finger protein